MKKIMLSAMAVMGFVALNNANAQHFTDTKFGVKAGLNLANTTNANEVVDDSKTLPTFNAGFVAVVPMSSTFSLRTGLDLQSKGFRSEETDGTAKYNPMYLELPVNVAVMLPFNERTAGYIGAGPYAAVGLFGKYQNSETGYDAENISWGNDVPGDAGETGSGMMKRFDAGVNFIGGIDFGRVGIHAQYGVGLANTRPGNSSYWGADKKFQNRTLGVSGIFYF